MICKDILVRGYFDDEETAQRDYIVEVDERKLKEWIKEENLDLLDYSTSTEKKIMLYEDLEKELGEGIDYDTFTVKLI